MAERRVLTVYGRAGCHLCDEMIAALREMQGRFHFAVEVVDVDGDLELVRRYGEKVPVLTHGARELGHYRVEPGAVAAYLANLA